MARYKPGDETFESSKGMTTPYYCVFEDDGQTAYFYVCDSSKPRQQILDALHIYNVNNVIDRDRESDVSIIWSADETKAGLAINGVLHALVDFPARDARCRTNFPNPSSWSGEPRGLWSDDLTLDRLR